MPALLRTWNFSTRQVVICEPPLTGDHLGLKTWGTAFAIAKKLEELGTQYMQEAQKGPTTTILELGAGTGLVGISAAMLWRADFVLTDLVEIVPNLQSNVERNRSAFVEGSSVTTTVLDWNEWQSCAAHHYNVSGVDFKRGQS